MYTCTCTCIHYTCTCTCLPVSNESINNISIMYIYNQHRVELFTIIFTQLRTDLNKNMIDTCTYKYK